MISKREVEHIAKLARLGLTRKDIKKFQKDLSSILDYFNLIKEVDVSEVEPTSHTILVENVTREDEFAPAVKFGAGAEESKIKSQELLELAPKTKNGYLKVKSVL